MRVNEIYLSIQGESSYMGRPCVLVRLTGCDLRCTYCDTEYAFTEGEEVSSDEMFSIVEKLGVNLVEITGGEPLLQKDVFPFIDKLVDSGFEVLVETSGCVPVKKLNKDAVKIMDIKCPSSGESAKNDWRNLDYLQPHDEIKFVIGDREDYDYALRIMDKCGLEGKVKEILMSPIQGKIENSDLAEWIIEDKRDVRMQLQLHKFIWPPGKRGV
ncbi:MAG: radical SAM protein [bacterium]|nr:radical SAM protein [bacterium]